MSAALQGDERSVRELVGRLTPAIQARVAHLLLRTSAVRSRSVRQEVEDLTQEVFLRLFAREGRALRAWLPQRGARLESFVSLIAERHVISTLRSRRKSPLHHHSRDPSELEDERAIGPDPDIALGAKDDLMVIADGLRAALSAKGLEMFYRLFVLEESTEEISDRTGQTAEAIYQWRHRIRKLIEDLAAQRLSAGMQAPSTERAR